MGTFFQKILGKVLNRTFFRGFLAKVLEPNQKMSLQKCAVPPPPHSPLITVLSSESTGQPVGLWVYHLKSQINSLWSRVYHLSSRARELPEHKATTRVHIESQVYRPKSRAHHLNWRTSYKWSTTNKHRTITVDHRLTSRNNRYFPELGIYHLNHMAITCNNGSIA